MRRFLTLLVLALLCPHRPAGAQQRADTSLAAAIGLIKAIDDHTHAPRALTRGDTLDPDIDALVCPSDDAQSAPQRTVSNPLLVRAWRDLYGYPYDDMSAAHMPELSRLREQTWAAHHGDFPTWLLDKIGTETVLANRVAMGAGLNAPRYRWIAFVDPLVFPLDNRGLEINPDRTLFFGAEARLFARYTAAAGITRLPPTLDGYVNSFMVPTLARLKRDGAVAIKLELAYLRSLDVAPAPHDAAARTYARYVAGGTPSARDYRVVQDYLLRVIVREAGRLDVPLQIHTGGGCGGYFDLAGSAPSRLSSLIDDPAFRSTRFVLLHGGGSYASEMGYLITKSNVWTDMSQLAFWASPRVLGDMVRAWIEVAPTKVLFGTDFFPSQPGSDGSEIAYLTTFTARQAITRALQEMVDDGDLTREGALQVAHQVLHDNAAGVYRLGAPRP
jgi:hypothetical protein